MASDRRGDSGATVRFNSLPEAKRYIYRCLALTLECDVDGGAVYMNLDDFRPIDKERVDKAVQQITEELFRKSKPPARSRRP